LFLALFLAPPPLPLLPCLSISPSQTLVSCDDVYKWARTSDEPWENALGLQGGDTEALLPAEASHSATLNGKNPFLQSTTVNTLAFVNSQEDSSTDRTGTTTDVQASKNLHTIYVKGLTSRDDTTHFSTTCHNFGGFRQPRDVCSQRSWKSNPAECQTKLEEKPKCKSVANMPKSVPVKEVPEWYRKYRYDPDAATLDAMTAFLLARVKFYPEKAKELFQSANVKYAFDNAVNYNSYANYTKGVNNPYEVDFDPSDQGDMIFFNEAYDVVKRELDNPGKPFCLTTLHWKNGWVDEVRSK
jgi:hypothetical protein